MKPHWNPVFGKFFKCLNFQNQFSSWWNNFFHPNCFQRSGIFIYFRFITLTALAGAYRKNGNKSYLNFALFDIWGSLISEILCIVKRFRSEWHCMRLIEDYSWDYYMQLLLPNRFCSSCSYLEQGLCTMFFLHKYQPVFIFWFSRKLKI